MKPLTPVNDAPDYQLLLDDDSWIMQEKLDGERRWIQSIKGVGIAYSRKGNERAISVEDLAFIAEWPADLLVDGEQYNGRFYAFDQDTPFARVRQAKGRAAKLALFNLIQQEGGEGVVFKKGNTWLRHKFYRTEDFLVTASTYSPCSISISYEGNPAGKCAVQLSRMPAVGSMAQIRFDGFTANGKLLRPVFIRVRND
jgi:ATP-dependent DNA ligase